MPKSKGRKKKKHPNTKSKKDITRSNGMEIVRKGRNVYVKSSLNEQQHQSYLEQIKENHPKAYEEIKNLINETVDLINQYDKIFVIGGIAAFGYNQMISNPADDGLSETLIEYCLSIALATSNSNINVLPTGEVLTEINERLIKIRRYFSHYYSFESATGKHSKIESELRYEMISEAIFMRGEGYLKHVLELYHEMFTGHDDFLMKHYGFKSKDIVETFNKLEEAYGCRILMPNGRPHPVQTLKLFSYASKNKISEKEIFDGSYLIGFSKEHPEIMVEHNHVVLFPLNRIGTYDRLFRIQFFSDGQERVVKALSMQFGENTSFITPDKFKYEILNSSEVFNRPIIEQDGNFYLFAMNLPARNLFVMTQSLIQRADKDYYKRSFLGNRIQIGKDEFIERKVLELFEKMLTEVKFYKGVHYNYQKPGVQLKCGAAADGRYELDILGVSEKAIYLIEVKAGLVSDASKRGALSSIKTDLTSIIGDAICQSYRAFMYTNEAPNPAFELADGSVIFPKNTQKIYRVSVSFSFVGTLISALSKLQQYGIIDENSEFAWAVNIYDLMVFAELMESEQMFMDYLDKRLPIYNNDKVSGTDELDLLGLYFTDDLKIDRFTRKSDNVRLYQFKRIIDNYYEKSGPRPFKKKHKK
ncbi:hypothetical protein [Flavobacterium sp. CSZ]|uniref:hypothetical protein n=1 Tax=Flavobacterium sp. CSZ TaxID=2783791 RepID=UPI00188D38D2|nr:hypothetical protein [Flavobacterium sp. CSZ]MBF4485768.1 hypothetical protein [Flavobacterium sp. CSZ]